MCVCTCLYGTGVSTYIYCSLVKECPWSAPYSSVKKGSGYTFKSGHSFAILRYVFTCAVCTFSVCVCMRVCCVCMRVCCVCMCVLCVCACACACVCMRVVLCCVCEGVRVTVHWCTCDTPLMATYTPNLSDVVVPFGAFLNTNLSTNKHNKQTTTKMKKR